jgi:hypothetical protein
MSFGHELTFRERRETQRSEDLVVGREHLVARTFFSTNA